ncbi:MAG: class I SAM-dependent DNA methyltransferase [Devosia sp.]|nr:class I SAM-dependent DNA methyltransferase [Devosia sp.]
MGLIFEELIRRFSELSNETAGEHFTPREVIRLMVNLLFVEDDAALTKPGVVRTIYDPTAGTGGMLSVAGEYLVEHNDKASLVMFGQELNPEAYAICKADMLIKGQDVSNIVFGNTLSDDGHPDKKFDYMLSNPPFGVEWKKVEKEVRREAEQQGFNGRFGPGLPRVSDGSLLFLMHLLSKMRPAVDGGSRFGIVLNGSPLFTGGAGSGESEIRRYVLENDLVEAIVALPTDMFYNTGISTYVWVLTNRKPAHRKGRVQLIDASGFWQKMRKSLGSKRKEMGPDDIATVTRLFGDFVEAQLATVLEADGKEVGRVVVRAGEQAPAAPEGGKVKLAPLSRMFPNEAFGYRTITVERPLRDENGKVVLGERGKGKGKPQADSVLRDNENVPLGEDVEDYFKREVLKPPPGRRDRGKPRWRRRRASQCGGTLVMQMLCDPPFSLTPPCRHTFSVPRITRRGAREKSIWNIFEQGTKSRSGERRRRCEACAPRRVPYRHSTTLGQLESAVSISRMARAPSAAVGAATFSPRAAAMKSANRAW